MIKLGIGNNFLRAYVTDDAGAAVSDATVTCEIRQAYGSDVAGLGSVTLTPIAGHTADATPYNYQATISVPAEQRPGRFYQATSTVTRAGLTTTETDTVEIDDN